jgi:hypothetical protein
MSVQLQRRNRAGSMRVPRPLRYAQSLTGLLTGSASATSFADSRDEPLEVEDTSLNSGYGGCGGAHVHVGQWLGASSPLLSSINHSRTRTHKQ